MIRRSLVVKATSLGVVQFLTTLREGTAQGVHIVLVVDVLAAPFQTGAILLKSLFPTLHRDGACQTTPYPGHSCFMQKHFLQRARLVASVIFHEGAKPMSSQRTLELGRDFSRVGRPEAPAPVHENHIGLAVCLLEPDVHCHTNLLDKLRCPFRHFPRELRVKHFDMQLADKETAPTTLSLCSMISA